ncbi:MAG TPA: thiamine pyrophosphate-dependent enzyme, partial [Phenylobacterium sp.]|nr:thiamine pyrophosphate-dependent enzyme [Phenylobacterium sp.]
MAREQAGAAGRRKANGVDNHKPFRAGGDAPKDSGKDELLRHYRDMLLIRRFEERAGQLYGMGLIGGFCHLYIGQEAIAVGVQA